MHAMFTGAVAVAWWIGMAYNSLGGSVQERDWMTSGEFN